MNDYSTKINITFGRKMYQFNIKSETIVAIHVPSVGRIYGWICTKFRHGFERESKKTI